MTTSLCLDTHTTSSGVPERDDGDLADLLADHTDRDAEEIRRAANEVRVQPLDEAPEEAGILPADE